MRIYNRGGKLYVYSKGNRKSTGLDDTKANRKLIENHFKNDEFFKNFNIVVNKKTVIDYCNEVLAENEKKLKYTTMRSYNSLFNTKIIPAFDKKYPNEITPLFLKEWYSSFTDKATLNTCVNGILKGAFKNAIIEGVINNSPFIVDFPVLKSNYQMNPFLLEEVELILSKTNGWFRNYLGVAFFTGMRPGEIIALDWKDINFNDYTISINKTRNAGKTTPPKTKSSIRVIDMLPQAEYYLKEQRKITGLSKNVFLSSRNIEINNSTSLSPKWKKIFKEVELEYRNLYQTRHTFASNMLSNKEDVFWVSKTLGHRNISITTEKYAKYIRTKKERKTTFLEEENYSFCTNLTH